VERKQTYSHMEKRKRTAKDPCPICEKELHYNKYYSKRIGIFDINTKNHDIIGWACPHCESEFDKKNNIMYIYGVDSANGKA